MSEGACSRCGKVRPVVWEHEDMRLCGECEGLFRFIAAAEERAKRHNISVGQLLAIEWIGGALPPRAGEGGGE